MCNLQLAQLDRNRRVAVYDVYLGNQAVNRVTARFFGTAATTTHEFGLLEVAANSAAHARFSVPYDRRNRCQALYLSVRGDDLALLAEARIPWSCGSSAMRIGAIFGISGLLALAGAALTLQIGAPLLGGRTGAVRAARLSAPSVAAALPTSVRAAVVQPERTAEILSLAARRDRYAGRTSILASYGAVAESGSIRILDAAGAIVGHAPFTRIGTSRVALQGEHTGPLQVELVVYRGRSHALASVEIPAEAARVIAPAVARAVIVLPPDDPFVIPDHVLAGDSLDIVIRERLPDMQIALQDDGGATVDEQSVPAGATSVSFTMPHAKLTQTLYIVGTYTQDSAEKTIVRAVRVVPPG